MSARENEPRLEYVEASAIALAGEGWDAWRVRFGAGRARTGREGAGFVVEPVVLEEWNGRLRIVAGFRRVEAARQAGVERIAAVVYAQGALSPREAFLMAAGSNAPETLSDADRAVALAKAPAFGFDDEEVATVVAPLLGLPRSVRVAREFAEIATLAPEVLEAIDTGARSREHAAALLLVPAGEREAFWKEFVEALRLSAGDTRAIANAALDLAARERRAVTEFVRELAAERAGSEAGAAAEPAAVKARLKEALARRMSPVVTEMEDEWRGLADSLGLPPAAAAAHSPSFEVDEIALSVRAGDDATLEAVKLAIERGLARGTFSRMLTIASRKTDEVARRQGGGPPA